MTVRLKDGSEMSRTVTVLKGTPDIPPTRDDVHQKFSLLTRHCSRTRMEEIFSRVQNFEKSPISPGSRHNDQIQVRS